jgi:hypothetical protein
MSQVPSRDPGQNRRKAVCLHHYMQKTWFPFFLFSPTPSELAAYGWLPTVILSGAWQSSAKRNVGAVSRVVAVSADGSPTVRNYTSDKDDAREPTPRIRSPTLTKLDLRDE